MTQFNYSRRISDAVNIGNIQMGGDNPIRIQSMTNTSTLDTEGSVAQCKRIIDSGADIVRLTAQGVREADNLDCIKKALVADNYNTPLVADIHFNPKAAFAAAAVVDKVRINPGNFVDPGRTFKHLEYTDQEYSNELQRISSELIPFINLCREHHTAVRLGVNHGSLSDRIMSRYGDTPAGMVESAMEFLRVFRDQKFHDVVISIKSSNTVVMVETVRRLVKTMDDENMHYPLHLGVTEAGDGEDGRIKSAVGIGTLLAEGIGDTIRVSLSEPPENEIPVARELVNYITFRKGHPLISGEVCPDYDPLAPLRRKSHAVGGFIGGKHAPIVVGNTGASYPDIDSTPDIFFDGENKFFNRLGEAIKPAIVWFDRGSISTFGTKPFEEHPNAIILYTTDSYNPVGDAQAFFHWLMIHHLQNPVILHSIYAENKIGTLQIKAAADFGNILLNGFADGIWIENLIDLPEAEISRTAFAILQAARLRTSKTEYIACPGCGRTLFDLQGTLRAVKAATAHLKHLKIGVMGCIVNGPGEMADADYGYVGAAKGKVSLYKGKQCIEKNIPEQDAISRLIEFIKQNGDWIEPTDNVLQ